MTTSPPVTKLTTAVAVLAMVFTCGLLLRASVPSVASGTWADAGSINVPAGAAAVALPDGRLLIAGGSAADGTPLTDVTVYDASTGSTTPVGAMALARRAHTATLLNDGRVLFAGGITPSGLTRDMEVFVLPPPGLLATGTHLGDMSVPRRAHAAALLRDGSLLIVGGHDGTSTLAIAEAVNVVSGASAGLGVALNTPRMNASATTLLDGRVLIAGGTDGTTVWRSVEIFDGGQFLPAGDMTMARAGHIAVLLPHNNEVLIAGGAAGPFGTSAELYAPWTGSFTATPNPMSLARNGAVAGGLSRYDVALVAGDGQATGEFFGYATIKTDKETYNGGDPITITGSGWIPGEIVTLTIREDAPTPYALAAGITANPTGNFSYVMSAPRQGDASHQLSERFYVNARGSAFDAISTFTDINAACSAPIVSLEPVNHVVTYGAGMASFEAAAAGTPAPTVQWQISLGGGAFTNLLGETSATLSISNPTVAMSGNAYRAVFTSTCDGPHAATTAAATLTVEKAHLTVTADDKAKIYDGSVFTAFTARISGFVPGETEEGLRGAGALTGTVAFTGSATSAVNASATPYTITPTANTPPNALAASNYDFQFSSGTLTISRRTPVVTWAPPAAISYPTALSSTQLNATAPGVPGTFAYTPAAPTVPTAGSHVLRAVFTPTDLTNYTTASVEVSLTVNKGTPIISWNNPAPITYPTPLGATQLNATASIAGGGLVSDPPPVGELPLPPPDFTEIRDCAVSLADPLMWTGFCSPVWKLPVGMPEIAFTHNAQISFDPVAHLLTVDGTIPQVYFDPRGGLSQYNVPNGVTTRILIRARVNADGTLNGGAGNACGDGGLDDVCITAPIVDGRDPAHPKNYGFDAPILRGRIERLATRHNAITHGTLHDDFEFYVRATGGDAFYTDFYQNRGFGYLVIEAFTRNTIPTWVGNSPFTAAFREDFGFGFAGLTVNPTAGLFPPSDQVHGTFTYTPGTGMVLGAGSRGLHVDFMPADTANYNPASADVTITVNRAAVTATAGSGSATYDGLSHAPGVCTITGVAPGALGDLTCANSPALVGPTAGTTTIAPVVAGTAADNFDITLVNGQFAIAKAPLQVTADNKAKTYDGNPFSPFTATITGFVNGETDATLRSAGALTGEPGFTGTATTAVNASTAPYVITPTANTLAATNYSFPPASFGSGSLTINRRATAVSWTNPAAISYPTALTAAQLNATAGGVSGTFRYTPATGAVLSAGPHTLRVDFTPADAINYTGSSAQVSLTINKGRPVINWNTPAAITYPTPLGAAQLNATATVPGGSSPGGESFETLSVAPLAVGALLAPSTPSAPPPDFWQINDCVEPFPLAGMWTGFCSPVWKLPVGMPEISFNYQTTAHYDPTSHLLAVDGQITAVYFDPRGGTSNYFIPGAEVLTTKITIRALVNNDGTLMRGAGNACGDGAADDVCLRAIFKDGRRDTANPTIYGTGAPLLRGRIERLATKADAITHDGALHDDFEFYVRATGGDAFYDDFFGTPGFDYFVLESFSHNTGAVTWIGDNPFTEAFTQPFVFGFIGPTVNPTAGLFPGNEIAGTFTYTQPAGTVLGAGTHTLHADFTPADLDNFESVSAEVSLVVDKAPSTTTVTFEAGPYAYRGTPFTASARVTGINGLDATVPVVLSGDCRNVTAADGCTATANYPGDANHAASVDSKSITITPIAATVTANDKSKIYGDTNPSLDATVTGTLSGETLAYSLAVAADETTGVGPVPINVVLLPNPNYDVTAMNGTLTINQRPLTITATSGQTKVYGNADPVFAFVPSAALVNGNTLSGALGRDPGEDVGNYALRQGSLTAGPNYVLAFVGADFSITPRHVVGTFTAANKPYDGNNTATVLTRAVPVAAEGDDLSLTGGTATFNDKNAGTGKTVTLTGATLTGAKAANYVLDSVGTATADITRRLAEVTVLDRIKTYGDANPSLGATIVGTVSGDTLAYSLAVAADETTGVGAVPINVVLFPNPNYDVTVVNGTLTIGQRPLTITATGGQTKVYGNTDPVFAFAPPGPLVNGDTLSGALGRAPGEPVGTYALQQGTLTAGPNYLLTFVPADFSITPRHVVGTFTAASKPYDGTDAATVLTRAVTNALAADGVTLTGGTATFSDKDAGTGKTVTLVGATLTGATVANYVLDSVATATADITRRPAQVTANDKSKTYGGANPTLDATVVGAVTGETLAYTLAVAADQTTGAGTVPIRVALLSNPNYDVTAVNGTLTINQRPLTITATSGQSKVYGNADPVFAFVPSAALINGDTLSGALARVSGEAIGTYALQQGTLTAGPNYVLTFVPAGFTITPRHVVGTFTAANKPYDGNNTATVLTRGLTNALAADGVTLTGGTATFNDKNAGTGRIVTLAGATLAGAKAVNYVLDSVATAVADITRRPAQVTANDKSKTYGDANPPLDATVVGALIGETLNYTIATTANAATGQGTAPITVALGANPNYDVTPVNGTLTIGQRPLTITAASGQTKVYGNADPVFAFAPSGSLVNGDTLSGALGRATGEAVGTYALQQGTLTAGPNYVLTFVGANFTITLRHVTGTFTAASKPYDGNNAATVLTRALTNALAADGVTLTGGTATFSDKNAGTGKIVTLAGATLAGAKAVNYVLDSVATATADITPQPARVTANDKTKTYGDPNPSLDATVVGTLTGETIAYTLSVAADQTTGVGAVPIRVILLSNPNYDVTAVNGMLTIGQRPLTITATSDQAKVYGNADPVFAFVPSAALVNGNTLTGALGRDPGEDVSSYALRQGSLTAGPNYLLTFVGANFNITRRHVTGTFTAANKVYDGNSTATVVTRTLSPAVEGDDLTLPGGTATFSDENVGNGKTVTLAGATLSGLDAANYLLDSVSTAAANITARPLTVTATGVNRVYNGSTAATVDLSDNRVAGDVLTPAYGAATFANKNAGTAKPISVTGITVTGADAGNYTFNPTAGATANISQAPAAPSITAADKVYDGTAAAAITGRTLAGAFGGDSVTLTGGTAAFNNATVGNGKPVTATGLTLSGTDAGNYVLAPATAATTANITPATPVISFAAAPVAMAGAPFTVSASTTNTDSPALTYSAVSGPCALVSGATFNSTGTGTCVVQASGPATTNFTSATATQSIAIQPASTKYETASGSFTSPAGSYAANPTLSGSAIINNLYARHTADGLSMAYVSNTFKFSYSAAALSFAGTYTQMESLVIVGNRSWLRGQGTLMVNGVTTPNSYYLVSFVDSTSSTTVDKVRVKIWKPTGEVVYDTQMGSPDSADAATPTASFGTVTFR